MRIKIDVDTTNISLTEMERLNIDVNKKVNHSVAVKMIDELKDKISHDNLFKENKIITKSVKLDVYHSSTIDLIKQKIEALTDLPLILKVELLTLLDDDNMFNNSDIIAYQLTEIIEKNDELALKYFMKKQFDYRVQVDKLTLNDIKTLFEDLFNGNKIDSIKLFNLFKDNYFIGFIRNNENYYYQTDVFSFLTTIKNYK